MTERRCSLIGMRKCACVGAQKSDDCAKEGVYLARVEVFVGLITASDSLLSSHLFGTSVSEVGNKSEDVRCGLEDVC